MKRIREVLMRSVSVKILYLLIIALVCFFLGRSTGNVEEVEKIVEVEKAVNCEPVEKIVEVEKIIEIPASCDKEKRIIGLYDDVLTLDNEAFNLLGSALDNPFDSYKVDRVVKRVEKIAAEKQAKMMEIMFLDN